MGIYSGGAGYGSYVTNVPERDLFAECGYNATFEEISLMMVAESEQNYNNIMKAIALDELAYYEEYGTEMIYEASGIQGVLDKIKAFFQKLIEKIRQVLHAFIAKLDSFLKSGKDFANKYQKEFSRKWSDVKGDFEFKGYKFSVKEYGDGTNHAVGNISELTKTALWEVLAGAGRKAGSKELKGINAIYGDSTNIEGLINQISTNNSGSKDDGLEAWKKAMEDVRDSKEDIEEHLRAKVANAWGTSTIDTNKSGAVVPPAGEGLSASEFSDTLFEAYRSGDNAKDSIEKNELSVSEIVGDLIDGEKWKRAANKSCSNLEKECNKEIKRLENISKQLVKVSTGKADYSKTPGQKITGNPEGGIVSEILSFVVRTQDYCKFTAQLYTQANGIYLQAIDDRERQNKAIMVKVIGSGLNKNMTESYKYDYDSGYQGSFIENVVLK